MPLRDTLLVAGSANVDFVVRAAHVPVAGETVLGRDFSTFPGGKGANQAVACARSGGVPTRMLVALGDDACAGVLEQSLLDAGVALQVVRSEHATGTAFICLADDAQNAITVAPGANTALRGDEVLDWDGVGYLLLQLETPLEAVTALACAARAAGARVVLNAAPARALAPELLELVDVLVVNEGELAALSGREGTVATCLARLDVRCVVVTLGARGCCARLDGTFLVQSGFKVQAVDTTAAGDTFCGALVAALNQGQAMTVALRFACAASALTCTRLGAQASIPRRAEVEAFLLADGRHGPTDDHALAAYCGLV